MILHCHLILLNQTCKIFLLKALLNFSQTWCTRSLKNQPAQKANELRYQSLKYASKAARSALYPTLAGFGGLSTNASNQGQPVIRFAGFLGYKPRDQYPDLVTVNGTVYEVNSPIMTSRYRKEVGATR